MLTRFARVIKVGALPSRRVMLHADQRYYDPIGLPLPSKELSPSAYTPGLCPTKARQTGLSCSEPDYVHVPPPVPRKRPDELTPDQGSPDIAFAVK